MTDELKETIICEHPDGIWIVLADENPPDIATAHDLLCGKYRALVIPFPSHVQVTNESSQPRVDGLELWGADVSRTRAIHI